jgi:Tol biopolymer transport system component
VQTGNEDLFSSDPNGGNEQNLSSSLDVRERSPRIDPFGRSAVYERICTVASDSCTDPGVSRIYLYSATPLTSGPGGDILVGTPYRVGADADPAYAPDASAIVFRRLTATGNGGLGTWDLLTTGGGANEVPKVIVSGPLYRGAPDWGPNGIVYVETDAAADRSELVLVQRDGSGRRVLHTEAAGYRMGAPRWLD